MAAARPFLHSEPGQQLAYPPHETARFLDNCKLLVFLGGVERYQSRKKVQKIIKTLYEFQFPCVDN
jgi:hypothetical protein